MRGASSQRVSNKQYRCNKQRPVTWRTLGGSKPIAARSKRRIGFRRCSCELLIVKEGNQRAFLLVSLLVILFLSSIPQFLGSCALFYKFSLTKMECRPREDRSASGLKRKLDFITTTPYVDPLPRYRSGVIPASGFLENTHP